MRIQASFTGNLLLSARLPALLLQTWPEAKMGEV